MCCGTFLLDVTSLLSGLAGVCADALVPQHAVAIVGGSLGLPHTPHSPSALCLLPEKRFFSSPFGICSIFDSTAGEGKVLLWCFTPWVQV